MITQKNLDDAISGLLVITSSNGNDLFENYEQENGSFKTYKNGKLQMSKLKKFDEIFSIYFFRKGKITKINSLYVFGVAFSLIYIVGRGG